MFLRWLCLGAPGSFEISSWRVMKGRSQRRVNKALAPCFKQSDLDPPTGGCSNQIVCVGRSPASHGFCGHAYVIWYLIHPMKDILTDLYMCRNHTLWCYNLTSIQFHIYIVSSIPLIYGWRQVFLETKHSVFGIPWYIYYSLRHSLKIIPHFLNNSRSHQAYERQSTTLIFICFLCRWF